MKVFFGRSDARPRRLVLLAAISMLSSTFAQQALAAPVDEANASCRASIAKVTNKLAVTTMKAFDNCIKEGLKGETVNCSDHVTADLQGKIDDAKTKLADVIAAKCDATTHAVALAEFERCGPPTGNDITQFANLSTCYNDMIPENIDSLRDFILRPDFGTATGDIAKCISAIAKSSTKLFKTILKEKHKLMKEQDSLGGDSNYVNPGDNQKIGDALFKSLESIYGKCGSLTNVEWVAVSSCDNDSVDAPLCILQNVFALADGTVAAAYDLPGICPAYMDILFLDGADGGVVKRKTDIDLGWTGLGHQTDSDSYHVQTVNVDCGGATDNDCSTCSLSLSCDGTNCRCSNDNFILCDEPLMADADDCGGNVCDVFFSPPLPASMASTPVCLVQRIESLGGSTSFENGATDLQVDLRTDIHIGITFDQPCPVCDENTGLCDGGERDGLACFADADSDFGIMAYDCPPQVASTITGAGLVTSFELSTGPSSLTANLPCDAPLGSSDCPCSACTGDTSIACSTDTVCTNAGAGLCATTQAGHGGEDREPNSCSDLVCTAIPGQPTEGECLADEETFCTGLVKGNGDGYTSCTTNGDCEPYLTGSTCTLTQNRRCFLDPISSSGEGGPRIGVDDGVLSSSYCMPTSSNGAVNTALGLPGPARMTLAAEFYSVCADAFTLWSPGGAVCQ